MRRSTLFAFLAIVIGSSVGLLSSLCAVEQIVVSTHLSSVDAKKTQGAACPEQRCVDETCTYAASCRLGGIGGFAFTCIPIPYTTKCYKLTIMGFARCGAGVGFTCSETSL